MRTLDHPSGLRVTIERARCVCSENCNRMAPRTFETDALGLVAFLSGEGDDERALREAVQSCPVRAITVTTKDGA